MSSSEMRFPIIPDSETFARWKSNPDEWHLLIREIARMENIQPDILVPFPKGTNLVVDLDGQSVLKLFPPIYRSQFVSERATLRLLDGRLSLPVPQIIAEGESQGWAHLILSRQTGIVGSEVWHSLNETEKEQVLYGVGQAIAEVQAVPPGGLSALEPAWPDFIARQAEKCMERHLRQGLAPYLLEDIGELLSEVSSTIPLGEPPAILTGEWVPENLILDRQGGRWKLAALIDFGDVMTGWREYDLLGPSTFMCAGRPSRVASLMQGYGLKPEDLDAHMRRRLLTLLVLHRASDFRKIDIDNWQLRTSRLTDLEKIIWPID